MIQRHVFLSVTKHYPSLLTCPTTDNNPYSLLGVHHHSHIPSQSFSKAVVRTIAVKVLDVLHHTNPLSLNWSWYWETLIQNILTVKMPNFWGPKIDKKVIKSCHVAPLLTELHWLSVADRITFKTLLCVYKSLNGLCPQHIRLSCG